jgi:hypothetical protein
MRVDPPLDGGVGIKNWNWDRLQGGSETVPGNQARAQWDGPDSVHGWWREISEETLAPPPGVYN